jgi:fermentation-respiration switch protein FrsA (DUF1100 family)
LRVPRVVWVVLLVPLLGYGGFVGALAWIENRLVFPVAPWTRHLAPPEARLGLRPERVTTVTSDGVRLVGWRMSADSSAPWILIFHGNAGNIGDGGRPEHYARLRALGLNVLTFDYRGYGESEGTPTEAGVYRDAEAAFAFLRDSLGVPPERTIIFGHSLGSAVAVDLASHVSAAGLILDGSFTSAPDAARYAYPFVPVRLIMRNRFASDEKIARATMPKLFLHGRWDQVIPISLGRQLYERAGGPKTFVQLNGGHDDAFLMDSAGYFGAVRAFLRR